LREKNGISRPIWLSVGRSAKEVSRGYEKEYEKDIKETKSFAGASREGALWQGGRKPKARHG
jgi:hypothetical protein